MQESKDMIYQSLDTNLIQFLFWISVWIKESHMVVSYWSIPVRLDHHFQPLDFKWIGGVWFTHTPSLKWFFLERWIGIRRREKKEEGEGSPRVHCTSPAASLRLGSKGQRHSKGSWSWRRHGQGQHGEGNPRVTMAHSIPSWTGTERRPERGWHQVIFRSAPRCQSPAHWTKPRDQGGAPGQRGWREAIRRRRLHQVAPELAGDARRRAEIRREILSAWDGFYEGKKKGAREGCWGLL
jgi:hypothetical protein